MGDTIEVSVVVERNISEVWESWTRPEHIKNWNFASEDWHCPSAVSEFSDNGSFSYRMEAKDGSFGFDYSGTFKTIDHHKSIDFVLDDNRHVSANFLIQGSNTLVIERFEADTDTPRNLQEQGWQAILENFKTYTETRL